MNLNFDFDISKYSFKTKLCVRYAETDKMGVVYYGNYFTWYEVARADVLKQLGYPYSKLEEDGVLLPVIEASSRYISPFRYDDPVLIVTKIISFTNIKIDFSYEAYNQSNMKLSNTGFTRHVFLGMNGKVIKADSEGRIAKIAELFKNYCHNCDINSTVSL